MARSLSPIVCCITKLKPWLPAQVGTQKAFLPTVSAEAAQHGLSVPVPVELIQLHGDRRSNAYNVYLQYNLQDKARVCAAMLSNIPSRYDARIGWCGVFFIKVSPSRYQCPGLLILPLFGLTIIFTFHLPFAFKIIHDMRAKHTHCPLVVFGV